MAPHADPTHPAARPTVAEALETAVDLARLAPSVHNTQPWRFVLHGDRLEIRADRGRQLAVLDPVGRALTESVGAALANARVALAASGWATAVRRCPDPRDPDLLAVLAPVEGAVDAALTALAGAVPDRRTNRRAFTAAELPDELLGELVAVAAEEGVQLIPVRSADHRRLVAALTQRADALQNADPAYRAELRRWTTRSPDSGDGVPPAVVPHVDGLQHDDLPLRDFDSTGTGELPPETRSTSGQTLVLLATPLDDRAAWLSAGEALERLLLVLTLHGWAASPLSSAVEVPVTRTQLRSALTWDAHPQMLLRIGRAAPTPAPPHRLRDDVVESGTRRPGPHVPHEPLEQPDPALLPDAAAPASRPVPDGRGGTTWA